MNRSRGIAFQVVNNIKKMIVFENLDKLPGEITLSKKLGVSRVVVREAIRILEYEGITRTVHGSGTYVIKKSGIKIAFNIPLEIEPDSPSHIIELLEIRRGLEIAAIRLAIMMANDYKILELDEALRKLEATRKSGDHDNLGKVDASFHKKIFEISGNKFLVDIYNTVFSALAVLWKSPLGLDTFGDRGLPYHKDVVNHIKARDLKKAINMYNKIIDLDVEDIAKASGIKLKKLPR